MQVLHVLLDLSLPFDTFHHNALCSRLKDMFALPGKLLEWLRCNMEEHSHEVSIHGI